MFTRNQFRNQKVLVAGCGRFGACLAAALSEAGYDILVIDKQKSAFRRLSDSFQGFEIEGDAADVISAIAILCWWQRTMTIPTA